MEGRRLRRGVVRVELDALRPSTEQTAYVEQPVSLSRVAFVELVRSFHFFLSLFCLFLSFFFDMFFCFFGISYQVLSTFFIWGVAF